MSYLKNKKASFYLMILSAILTAAGLFFYQSAAVKEEGVQRILLIGIGVTVLMLILSAPKKGIPLQNLCATAAALVFAWGLISSVNAQLDSLGWWIAGLYTYDQVKGYLFFAALVGAAVVLDIIASFVDIRKAE